MIPTRTPFGRVMITKSARFTVPYVHRVGQHIENSKIVLDDHDRAVHRELTDQFGRGNTLVDVQERCYFIEEIEVGVPGKAGRDRHPLEFSPGQRADLMIDDCIKFEGGDEVGSFPRSSVVLSKSRIVPEKLSG